ncbi:MAG: dihydrodipicolinate reductase [Lachnospiraceae bacterium]|nr:dihydrodipicolinate reductase [Lachnospiraceae bacterium]
MMTLIKERAVKMIQHMPEDTMFYVVNILENLQAMSINREKDKEMAKAALEDILNMEKRLPADFDIKRELAEARDERYGNIN